MACSMRAVSLLALWFCSALAWQSTAVRDDNSSARRIAAES